MHGFLLDKQFCAGEGRTEVLPPRSRLDEQVLESLRKIAPGPNGQYGFQSAAQRLSFAYRYDDGHGVSAIVPIGAEVPFFSGWAVMKLNVVAQTLDGPLPPLARTSIEAMYSPSASRPFDWYAAVGAERYRSPERLGWKWQPSEEIGMKFRFSTERLRVLRFVGGRVGLRATSLRRPENVRFVYEFGAGSW